MLSKRKLTVFLRFVDIDNLVVVASWLVDGISSIIDGIKFLTCLAATNYPKWSKPIMAYYIPWSLAPQNTYHMYLRDIATVSFTWSREHNSSLVYLRLHSIVISFTIEKKHCRRWRQWSLRTVRRTEHAMPFDFVRLECVKIVFMVSIYTAEVGTWRESFDKRCG